MAKVDIKKNPHRTALAQAAAQHLAALDVLAGGQGNLSSQEQTAALRLLASGQAKLYRRLLQVVEAASPDPPA